MALSNSQYNAILREYERQQATDRREHRDRLEEVYAKIPEMRALDKQAGISALSRFDRALKDGTDEAAKGFSEEVAEIERKKKALLKENGFPEDFMEMKYLCPDCRDTGLIEGRKCHCFQAKIIKLLYAQSNIDRIMEKENFNSFSFDFYDDAALIPGIGMTEKAYMKKVFGICRQYVEDFKEKRGSLLFLGNPGVGKTFLSNCIAKELIDRYYSVIYLTANELFDCVAGVRMQKTDDPAVKELYGFISDCDLLIIDDLGTEMTNTWTASQFFYLVNARLTAAKATIISTNLSMKAMRDIYSERVTSRIASGYTIVPVYGEDIRLKKKLAEN